MVNRADQVLALLPDDEEMAGTVLSTDLANPSLSVDESGWACSGPRMLCREGVSQTGEIKCVDLSAKLPRGEDFFSAHPYPRQSVP